MNQPIIVHRSLPIPSPCAIWRVSIICALSSQKSTTPSQFHLRVLHGGIAVPRQCRVLEDLFDIGAVYFECTSTCLNFFEFMRQ